MPRISADTIMRSRSDTIVNFFKNSSCTTTLINYKTPSLGILKFNDGRIKLLTS